MKINGFNFFSEIKKFKLFNPYGDLQKMIEDAKNINEEKFCVNCKFYLSNSKCSRYPKIDNSELIDYLVSGNANKLKDNTKYYYCSTARSSENMCTKDGLNYEQRD
jgi:hypothetical protein